MQSSRWSPIPEFWIGLLNSVTSSWIHRPKIWYKVIPFWTWLFVSKRTIWPTIVAVGNWWLRFSSTMEVLFKSLFILGESFKLMFFLLNLATKFLLPPSLIHCLFLNISLLALRHPLRWATILSANCRSEWWKRILLCLCWSSGNFSWRRPWRAECTRFV